MIYNGILLSNKKNEILLLVTAWMDLEGIMLGKLVRERECMFSLIYGIWKNKWTNITNEKQL